MSAIGADRAFRIDYEGALVSIGRDRRWPTKIALGALFGLLSPLVIGYVLTQGYLLTLTERVARLEAETLPEWDDWGEILRKGAIVTVVNLAYYIPYIILLLLVYVGQFTLQFSLLQTRTFAMSQISFLGFIFILIGFGSVVLLGLALAVLLPAVHAQLALHDADPRAAFRLGEVFDFISRHRGQYALAIVLWYAANYLLVFVGYLACCIGVFATSFIGQIFLAHMIGQLCWYERQRDPRGGRGAR